MHIRIILLMLFTLPVTADERLRIVVLDVGEGQAVLLQQGDRGVLVDTGHFGMARHLLDRVESHGVNEIDYLFLTHLHADHASGYFRVREAFSEMKIIDSGHVITGEIRDPATRWVYKALIQDPARRIVRAGDVIKWIDTEIHVLWPIKPAGPDLNSHSLVLALSHGRSSILIMGDAGMDTEFALLRQGVLPFRVDLLVVGHHGSARTSSVEFLNHTQPVVSIISSNTNNIHGYPDQATVSRLERYSGKLMTTYEAGEICLEFCSGSGILQSCPSML